MRLTRFNSPNLNVNTKFFDNMKENEHWILGLLMSDGCIYGNRIMFSLNVRDRETIEKLMSLMKCKGKIVDNLKTDSCGITFRNQILVDKLAEFGCIPAKSLTMTFPEKIDIKYISHFLRGIFDGDGCVTYNKSRNYIKCGFTGNEEFLKSIKLHLKNLVGINSSLYKSKTSNACQLDISGNIQSVKFLNWIYNESLDSNRMLRKYNKAMELYRRMIQSRKSKIEFNLNLSI